MGRMTSLMALSATMLEDILSTFDNTVYGFVSGHMSEEMTRFMKYVTFWGSELAITVITLLILFTAFIWNKKEHLPFALLIAANIAIGALLNYILKQLIQRQRPDLLRLVEIGGYSFPSGHSMSSIIFYGFIAFLCIRYLKHRSKYFLAVILGLFVIMIGISRIYLGVHYASDVLGGFIFGSGWIILCIKLAERYGFLKKEGHVIITVDK